METQITAWLQWSKSGFREFASGRRVADDTYVNAAFALSASQVTDVSEQAAHRRPEYVNRPEFHYPNQREVAYRDGPLVRIEIINRC